MTPQNDASLLEQRIVFAFTHLAELGTLSETLYRRYQEMTVKLHVDLIQERKSKSQAVFGFYAAIADCLDEGWQLMELEP